MIVCPAADASSCPAPRPRRVRLRAGIINHRTTGARIAELMEEAPAAAPVTA
jgi:hypothetical protein